jgi:galactose mutarotase-like enzyme
MPSPRRPAAGPSSSPAAGAGSSCGSARGYPFAQVYAPAEDAVIAFEPMTAPTDALVGSGDELPLVAPGDSFTATFSISVGSG